MQCTVHERETHYTCTDAILTKSFINGSVDVTVSNSNRLRHLPAQSAIIRNNAVVSAVLPYDCRLVTSCCCFCMYSKTMQMDQN
ncbi:Uncharacterised protein g11156 [Pycnogonum litorale]